MASLEDLSGRGIDAIERMSDAEMQEYWKDCLTITRPEFVVKDATAKPKMYQSNGVRTRKESQDDKLQRLFALAAAKGIAVPPIKR